MLTARGGIAIVSGVFTFTFGFVTVNYFLVLVGVMVVIASVISMPYFALSANFEGVEVTRTLDKEKVFAEEFVHVTVKVVNKGRMRIDYLEVEDGYPEVFTLALGENKITARLDPGGEVSFSYVLQCRRRGVHRIGPTKLIMRDRLGIVFEEEEIPVYTELLVYPSYKDVRKLEALGAKRVLSRLFGVHRTRQKGIGVEFFGLREYFPMDDFRRIDWKATARTGDLIVREFESERNIKVMILLDCSSSMGGGLPDNTKLDFAIRAAVMLAKVALERRDEVGLAAFSDKIHQYVPPKPGKDYFYKILEALAFVEPTGGTYMKEAVEWVIRRAPRRMLYILISDLEGELKDIVDAAKVIRAHRNHLLVLSPFGPWFEVYPEDLSPVDRALAEAISEELLEYRRKIGDELAKMEVRVVDVGPDDFLPAIITQYLNAKRRGIALR
nr:DUF58 domain-containing protein [Candidatus Bathyarchaeota archaeon]